MTLRVIPEVTMSTDEPSPRLTLVIHVSGEIDRDNASALSEILDLAIGARREPHGRYGGRDLHGLLGRCCPLGGNGATSDHRSRLLVRNPRPVARKVFEVLGLDGILLTQDPPP